MQRPQRFGDPMERFGHRGRGATCRPDNRLYVGKWASGRDVDNHLATIDRCAGIVAGAGPIEVVELADVVAAVRQAASSKTY